MTTLAPVLARLGLSEYLDGFVAEGFDTWETLLDITESDLRELGVKLGHRRKLQREIAHERGIGAEQVLVPSPANRTSSEGNYVDSERGEEDQTIEGTKPVGSGGKRKYRRHPKPDESAPERAPSAYVIFSNRVREDLKPQSLSFTEIAKRVGEQWQSLPPDIKSQYESQASSAKERYRADLDGYKKTDKYREYNEYLVEFKQKNAGIEEKRPRLDKQPSGASSTSGPEQDHVSDHRPSVASSRRAGSFGSVAAYSANSDHPSPTVTNVSQTLPSIFAGPPQFRSSSPTSRSTPDPWNRRESSSINSVFSNVDKPPTTPVPLPSLASPPEMKESRMTSSHLAGLMQESDMLRSRPSPLTILQREPSSASTASSPMSSAFSGNTAPLPAPPSSLTSLTSNVGTPQLADARSSCRLPSISTLVKPPTDLSRPPSSKLPDYPTLRPSFSPCTLPPPIQTVPIVAAVPIRPSPLELGHRQPSFKGEYGQSASAGQGASFKGEYDPELFPRPLGTETDPLSILAYAGRMVDRDGRSGCEAEPPKSSAKERRVRRRKE